MDDIDQEHRNSRAEMPAHTPGTPKGEELVQRKGREAGRQDRPPHRTARDSTKSSSVRPRADRPPNATDAPGMSDPCPWTMPTHWPSSAASLADVRIASDANSAARIWPTTTSI